MKSPFDLHRVGPFSNQVALIIAFGLFPMPVGGQATVDASARQAKAADFTPVLLPAVDPLLLPNTVSTPRPAPAKPAIELQYAATPVSFVYPSDARVVRWITVKNNGGYTELQFDATVSGPGGFSIPDSQVMSFPQPGFLYLQPNESQRIWVSIGWSELNSSLWTTGGTYDYRLDIRVYPKLSLQSPQPDPAQLQTASLHNSLYVASVTLPPPSRLPTAGNNAAIAGSVSDAATGKPIANAQVQLISNTNQNTYSPMTDASGAYTISVTAYQATSNGIWQDFGVSVTAPGYAEFHTAVAPHSGDVVTVNAAMTPALPPAAYAVTSRTDTTLNLYSSDRSQDGSHFGLTPFHSLIPPGTDADSYLAQAKLWFFGADGTALWQFPLYGETVAVSVSGDSSLVATARPDYSRSDNGVYLLDKAGNVLWFVNPGPCTTANACRFYEVRISHDNKSLAVGDTSGNLYLFDIASKKLVWQRFLNGQVRSLIFASDNAVLYAASGDGYLYTLKADGSLLWRSYVGAWTTALDISPNYILAGGKEGYYVALLDRPTGRILWEYPLVASPYRATVAPDESYVLVHGSDNSFGTLLLDIRGVLLCHEDVAETSFITADSANILLSGQDGSPGNIAGSWVRMIDRLGRQVWKTSLDSTLRGPKGYAWMSGDGSKVVASSGSSVYFLSRVSGPTLSASPAAISLNYVPGGTCSSQTVSLSSTSPASGLSWSATASVSWLTLGAASGSTPSSLTVTCTPGGLTIGKYSATVQIAAGSATASVSVDLTIGASIDSVVSAASGDARLAPGQIVSIYGRGLAGAAGISVTDSAGVSRAATLFFVSAGQINALIPEDTAVGSATLGVNGPSGALGTAPIVISAIAPALFSVGNPPNAPVAALAFYYSLAGQLTGQSAVFQCDASGNCATVPLDLSLGDQLIFSLYGTGIHHGNKVTCQIGTTGVTVLGAATTQFPGEDQVNILVPKSLAGSGTQRIVLTVDGVASNAVPVAFK